MCSPYFHVYNVCSIGNNVVLHSCDSATIALLRVYCVKLGICSVCKYWRTHSVKKEQ